LSIVTFILGDISDDFLTLLAFILMNAIAAIISAKNKKAEILRHFKRLLGYIFLVIAAHRLDCLVVNKVFEWEGSTKTLAILSSLAFESKNLLQIISSKLGISIPKFFIGRLDQIIDVKSATEEDLKDRVKKAASLMKNVKKS
jgi:phage-related holin